MNSSELLSVVTFGYGIAATLYLASWIFQKPFPGQLAKWAAILTVIGNLAGFFMRWAESYDLGIGHAPLSNMYESLVFFALTIGVIYLFIEKRYQSPLVGVFATPIACLAMAYASMSPNISDRIQPLVPALKSNWLIAHVFTCFFGYAAFAIAFGVSIMYLLKKRERSDGKGLLAYLPQLNILDDMTHRMVLFGFLFLSVGIITGAVWANSAWGSYWSWDPKETWSLITWFVYATLLHARLIRGWYGKKIAYLSIIGFVAMLFTYFGVNYLPGLHSYGSF
jgi:cytochrome c-type biogenesis protein CcsB